MKTWTRDETSIYLYNPSKSDFIVPMASEDATVTNYTLPSRLLIKLPAYIATHCARALARKLALEDISGKHFEDKYNEYLASIYVKIE